MAYTKRSDGRKFEELRKMEAKVGVVERADGSAMFKIGKTIAIASVYGPRELYPKFLKNSKTGILRCNYNMMAFSGSGDRVRPGGGRRSKELSMVIEKAILPVIDLTEFPNADIDSTSFPSKICFVAKHCLKVIFSKYKIPFCTHVRITYLTPSFAVR